MFSPITAADNIKDEFIGYISTLFHISDKDYAAQFAAALREEGAIAKGPYLDVSDSYKTGKSLAQMIEEGEASSLFHSLEGDIPDGEKEIQINRGLYLHQERALRKTNKGKNLIVTTGTGSGKTECFIIPIINHLLREAEEGTLSSGVRAILIYPMNALANDQMKRLRNLLKSYPEITFGVYNSSTKQNEQDGIAEYGKVYKDANGRPLKPLKNEIVSRDQMQKTPPHILVTNYAMLEYMMLRPKDDLVFSRAKLRFLVLDEAHIYRGATGMETSLLLKRLKARISNPANVLHILTSATLGGKEADDDIVKFAETLCNASFYAEDIIRSQSVVPSYDREPVDVPLSMFAELIDPQKPLNVIADDYGLPIPDGIPDAEYLYDLCVSASVYRDLRRITSHPMTIPEITRALRATHNVTQQDVVNIIGVAAQASKNKSALIKARYHMFAKALEGAYVTLGQNKKLMLNRNRSITIGDENWKVFECAICDDCGRVAVAGKEVDGKLEFANSSYDPEIEYYLLRDSRDIDLDLDEEDEDDSCRGHAQRFGTVTLAEELRHGFRIEAVRHLTGTGAHDPPSKKAAEQGVSNACPKRRQAVLPAKLAGIADENDGGEVARTVGERAEPGAHVAAAENEAVNTRGGTATINAHPDCHAKEYQDETDFCDHDAHPKLALPIVTTAMYHCLGLCQHIL